MSSGSASEFYFLKIKPMWQYFKGEHLSFWMICCYLFFEYTRPQAIFPVINFLPWTQLFLLGSIAGAFLDKSVKWVNTPANFFMIWLAIAIYISSLTAYYPHLSKEHYIDFYGWFVIYFLIINIVNTEKRFYLFLIIFILCAAKISIGTSKSWAMRGFGFTSWGLMGPKGFFQNSGELSILMLTLFPVAFKLWEFLKDKISRIESFLLSLFWITPILTILGASSRGSQLALAVLLLMMFRKNVFKVKPLIITAVFMVALFSFLPEEQKDRFRSSGDDRTSQQRLLYWERGWEMMKSHPFLGVGYFNFSRYFATHYPSDMLYDKAELPHNIFIQVGTDSGFIGLIPFILLIVYCFVVGYKMAKKEVYESNRLLSCSCVGMSYGILGFMLAGQFVTVAYYPFLWIGLSFLVAGSNVFKITKKKKIVRYQED